MSNNSPTWLDDIRDANTAFAARVTLDDLPVARTPSPYAVITCMDPRVNLECIGIQPFGNRGEGRSSVRVIRTIGAMSENRSLVIGLFLADIREIAIIMHSDCGCCLAASKIGTIVENMSAALPAEMFSEFRSEVGRPFESRLAGWLKVFNDPREAVRDEVEVVRALPFIPKDLPVHGMVYELATAKIDIVVNGYD